MRRIGFAYVLLVALSGAWSQSCPNAVDSVDPDYGGRIRQLVKPDGHEHNLYYDRDPWNANQSYMLGIQSDLEQQNWNVVLYDGDGCFPQSLLRITRYDWRLARDREDPEALYTWSGSRLYRYHVDTGEAVLLKDSPRLTLAPAGLRSTRPATGFW